MSPIRTGTVVATVAGTALLPVGVLGLVFLWADSARGGYGYIGLTWFASIATAVVYLIAGLLVHIRKLRKHPGKYANRPWPKRATTALALWGGAAAVVIIVLAVILTLMSRALEVDGSTNVPFAVFLVVPGAAIGSLGTSAVEWILDHVRRRGTAGSHGMPMGGLD